MKGVFLKIYVLQFQKQEGILLYEWLLEKAKKLGYAGGSAFLSLAGFGHHRILHEEHFYELGSNLPVEVGFVLTEQQAEEFLEIINTKKIELFYVKIPAEYEVIR